MNEQTIRTLEEQGGKRWTKGDYDRIYFDTAVVLQTAGMVWESYGTGNVSHAQLDGQTISNSEAKRIFSAFSSVKLWYDITTGKFMMKDSYGELGRTNYQYLAQRFVSTMKALIA